MSEKPYVARFAASILHALEPIIRSGQGDPFHMSIHGIFIEPAGDEGVRIIATDGHAIAICFDPKGRASRAFRAYIPNALFVGVTPPEPIQGFYEGDWLPHDLPDWAQPDQVMLFDRFAFVTPKENHPDTTDPESGHVLASVIAETGSLHSGGYRVSTENLLNWRTVPRKFKAATEPSPIFADPKIIGMFSRLTAATDAEASHMIVEQGDVDGPLRVTGYKNENFVGFFMPIRAREIATPEWFQAAMEAEGCAE